MLLRRYHKAEEKLSNDFIADVEKTIEQYGEEVVFDHKIPTVEEVSLEELIEVMEDDLSLEELTVKALTEIALEKGIEVPKKIKKEDLIKLIREG